VSTKATLETIDGKVVVEVLDDGMTLNDLFQRVVEPLLRGTGYSEETIKELLGE
jgi:hypothetical protein